MKYSELNLGQIEAIVNKLGGMDGVNSLLADELVVSKRGVSVPTDPREWTIWKTIKLGTGLKSADDFRKALKKADCGIGDWGNDILGKPAFQASDTETELDLVVVSNADLGFKNGAKVSDTYARAKELGLELCPNEVGPQLRLQYTDQPKGEWLLIAMEPIAVSDGGLLLFRVARHGDGERWLRGYGGDADDAYVGDFRFVFVRRKE